MADLTRAYLSLGSNLGDRMGNLLAAVRALSAQVRVVALSPVYETAPLGPDGSVVKDQDPYLNCALQVETSLTAQALHAETGRIESLQGRERRARWQPRPIDIDIVLFGQQRIDTPGLVIPHTRMRERAFVLRPLLDLDPGLRVSGIGALAPLLPSLEWQDVRLYADADAFARAVSAEVSPTPEPDR